MVITQIQNLNEANRFLDSLRGINGMVSTERTYALHLLVLTECLHKNQLQLIIDNLEAINTDSGHYIAIHLLVSGAKIDVIKTRERIGSENKREPLSLPQIEGLCQSGPKGLSHKVFDQLQTSKSFNPSEPIARELGITDQLPCLVLFDALRFGQSQTYLTLPFPSDTDELSTLLASLKHCIFEGQDSYLDVAGKLEQAHQLYEEIESLKHKRGAPEHVKTEKWLNFLMSITFVSKFPDELERIQSTFGGQLELPEKQIEMLCLLNSKSTKNPTEQIGKKLSEEFSSIFSQLQLTQDSSTCLETLRKALSNELTKRAIVSDPSLEKEIEKKSLQLEFTRLALNSTPSITTAIERSFTTAKIRGRASETAKAFFGSAVSEMSKPSFWLKLFGVR